MKRTFLESMAWQYVALPNNTHTFVRFHVVVCSHMLDELRVPWPRCRDIVCITCAYVLSPLQEQNSTCDFTPVSLWAKSVAALTKLTSAVGAKGWG